MGTKTSPSPRQTRSCTRRPDGTFWSSRAASTALDTAFELTDRITSPCRSGPAVELHDHVARLHAGFRRRAARDDLRHHGARARLQPEVLEAFTRDRQHLHTDAPADDLALVQLRQQLSHRVARHREPDADIS